MHENTPNGSICFIIFLGVPPCKIFSVFFIATHSHAWYICISYIYISRSLCASKVPYGDTRSAVNDLTHWGNVMHICVSRLTSIGSDNGLSLGRRQAIIWTNAGILLIGPIEKNFSEILIAIQIFSFKKMHLKMSSGKCLPFCLSLNMLMARSVVTLL